MNTFTINGTVPNFKGSEFFLPADNYGEFDDWLQSNGIDTKINPKSGIKIRGSLAAECNPGVKIRHKIELWDRSDGRRIRGLSVQPF